MANSIYIKTSIISYLTSRTSRNLIGAARQLQIQKFKGALPYILRSKDCFYLLFVHLMNYWERMMNDEIMAEVRAIREAHTAKFDFDLDAIYEDIKRCEAERIACGAKFIDPPASISDIPHSIYQRIRFVHLPVKEQA
jgi:hypothetical protein